MNQKRKTIVTTYNWAGIQHMQNEPESAKSHKHDLEGKKQVNKTKSKMVCIIELESSQGRTQKGMSWFLYTFEKLEVF